MPIPMDLSSTDDHGHHLRNEAARTARRTYTLRPHETPVKNQRPRSCIPRHPRQDILVGMMKQFRPGRECGAGCRSGDCRRPYSERPNTVNGGERQSHATPVTPHQSEDDAGRSDSLPYLAMVILGTPTRGTSLTVIWNKRYNNWNASRFQRASGPVVLTA